MHRPNVFWLAAVALGLTVLISPSACGNQAEGQRCDTLNGNDDCNDGLACVPSSNAQFAGVDVCCPPNPADVTTAACTTTTTLGDAGPGVDSGSDASGGGDTGTDSAAADTGVDAPIDTGVDAPADAADDGG